MKRFLVIYRDISHCEGRNEPAISAPKIYQCDARNISLALGRFFLELPETEDESGSTGRVVLAALDGHNLRYAFQDMSLESLERGFALWGVTNEAGKFHSLRVKESILNLLEKCASENGISGEVNFPTVGSSKTPTEFVSPAEPKRLSFPASKS